MEEDQELKFVCKLCFKKYPCGKSLGGHMRSHVVSNPADSDDKLDSNIKKFSAFGGIGYPNDAKMVDFVNGQSSYGLRENPRKSWRAADSNFPLPQERICKQCGKGFHSLKALCGHMACHSDKDRGFKDDHSWSTSENHKPLMDSHSDTEGEDRVVQTRSSKGKKVRKIVIKSSPFSLANNGSSSVSEVDGDEQEEVAMCLMMLSRDSGNRGGGGGGVYSVVESSDNNSVILETKSSSIDMKIAKRDALRHAEDQKKGELKLKGSVCTNNAEMENSDSGYFLDECAKAESEVSVDGFRDISRSYKMKENDDDDEYRIGGGSRKRNDPTANADSSHKRIKYECFNCKKSFKSYQALGGHRPCHKKSSAFYETSRYETGENSLDDSAEYTTSKRKSDKKTKAKKNKGHACPFCHRVFKNGQALGGHKRSHFIGGHDVNNNPTTTLTKPDLLDLNLPAPQDDADDGNEQFSSW